MSWPINGHIGTPNFEELAHRFDGSGVCAIVLWGSHARGDAGPYSDVDLQRLVDARPVDLAPDGSYLIDNHLVVVGTVTRAETQAWFSEAQQATNMVAGLRAARALLDREDIFAQLQARAHAFQWDSAMQAKANAYASEQMVGWIEEVHKALQGLLYDDVGRLLLGKHGLTWGLVELVKVQHGILLTTENEMIERVMASVGLHTEWTRLCRIAFGLHEVGDLPPSLGDEVRAGLRLYVATATLLGGALQAEHAPLVAQTVERIQAFL